MTPPQNKINIRKPKGKTDNFALYVRFCAEYQFLKPEVILCSPKAKADVNFSSFYNIGTITMQVERNTSSHNQCLS